MASTIDSGAAPAASATCVIAASHGPKLRLIRPRHWHRTQDRLIIAADPQLLGSRPAAARPLKGAHRPRRKDVSPPTPATCLPTPVPSKSCRRAALRIAQAGDNQLSPLRSVPVNRVARPRPVKPLQHFRQISLRQRWRRLTVVEQLRRPLRWRHKSALLLGLMQALLWLRRLRVLSQRQAVADSRLLQRQAMGEVANRQEIRVSPGSRRRLPVDAPPRHRWRLNCRRGPADRCCPDRDLRRALAVTEPGRGRRT